MSYWFLDWECMEQTSPSVLNDTNPSVKLAWSNLLLGIETIGYRFGSRFIVVKNFFPCCQTLDEHIWIDSFEELGLVLFNPQWVVVGVEALQLFFEFIWVVRLKFSFCPNCRTNPSSENQSVIIPRRKCRWASVNAQGFRTPYSLRMSSKIYTSRCNARSLIRWRVGFSGELKFYMTPEKKFWWASGESPSKAPQKSKFTIYWTEKLRTRRTGKSKTRYPIGFPLGLVLLDFTSEEVPHSRYFTSRVQLSSLAMSARLSHSAIGSPYDRTPAHCPNAAKLRPSPWWSSSGVTATTCLHSNWLLTKSLERNKHTHRNARIPSG